MQFYYNLTEQCVSKGNVDCNLNRWCQYFWLERTPEIEILCLLLRYTLLFACDSILWAGLSGSCQCSRLEFHSVGSQLDPGLSWDAGTWASWPVWSQAPHIPWEPSLVSPCALDTGVTGLHAWRVKAPKSTKAVVSKH